MSITASTIVEDAPQADGRRDVLERHTDHLGVHHFRRFVAAVGEDVTTPLASRATLVEAQLRDHEIAANMAKALNGETAFTFQHSTVPQNRTAVRELFKTATRWELLTLGWVINELALSDNQLKALFEVNDAALPALKTKLAGLADKYTVALAEAGQ